jgi:hypothetical protein
MRGKMTVGVMAAFRSTDARQHVETLHGIDPGLIIIRVALFRQPLGTFHQQLSSTPRHRAGKKKVVRLPSIYPKLILRANLLTPR